MELLLIIEKVLVFVGGIYKMENENPKEKFLNLLLNIVFNFEKETGVEINNICFNRADTTQTGDLCLKSLITEIQMEMK